MKELVSVSNSSSAPRCEPWLAIWPLSVGLLVKFLQGVKLSISACIHSVRSLAIFVGLLLKKEEI